MSRPLRVILNDRLLFSPLSGVGHYIRQLLDEPPADPDVCVVPFLSSLLRRRPPSAAVARTAAAPRRPPPWLRVLIQGAYDASLALACRRFDLYHEPNHIPVLAGVPAVTTIHDISVIIHPEWHPADRVRWYARRFAGGLARSARIIVPSRFTARELVERCRADPAKIDVIPLAPRRVFRPPAADRVQTTLALLDLPDEFFLFVGTFEPRKNVEGLLVAYAALPASIRASHPLVIAGVRGWGAEPLEAAIRRHRLTEDVLILGYLSDDQLACLYGACTAFVWPTLYEGFGLPPLEALACGAPVIVSNVASLPEVLGDAAVLLDPADPPAWTAAMHRMIEDPPWRTSFRRRGPLRAAEYSWARCGRATLAAYRRAVAN